MSDVFISYSRSDQAKVALIARAVEAEGYSVWWDAELPPHQSYGDVITAKIAEARAAIVVWSAEAVKSEWVRAEADMARNQKKLVQTALGNVMPPLPFNQIQYAELGDWQGESDHPSWRKVKASLTDLCGEGGGGRPATPPSVAPAPQWNPPPSAATAAAPAASKWPLFAGLGVAGLAIALALGFVLGERDGREAEDKLIDEVIALEKDARSAAADAAPSPPVAASPAPVATRVVVVHESAAAQQMVEGAEQMKALSGDFILPQSSSRLLTRADIAGFGPMQIRLARNEIYARHGRRFRDPALAAHFAAKSWYTPISDEVTLSRIEQANVTLLQAAENRRR